MISLLNKISRRLSKTLYRPSIAVSPSPALIRLGSAYGGWTFEHRPSLRGCTIVSCGLGEDASFDVEFAARYGATVLLVDPTPRAVAHHAAIERRVGQASAQSYSPGGDQPPAAYDLSAVGADQLMLVPKALWTDDRPVRFYEPADSAHVSHSITFAAGDTATARYIEVAATTLAGLMQERGLASLELLKLDIEGAEAPVLRAMLAEGLRPAQLLVEFDVLREPGRQSRDEVLSLDALLRAAGYECRFFDGDRNYLYVRP